MSLSSWAASPFRAKPAIVAVVGFLPVAVGWLVARAAAQGSSASNLPLLPFYTVVVPLGILVFLLLPNWLLLLIGVPACMILSDMALLLPVFSLGEADIQVYDCIVALVVLKVAIFAFLSRYRVVIPAYRSIGAFLAVLLGATLVAYYRFRPEVFAGEVVALARFFMQTAVCILLVYSVRTARQLELSYRVVQGIGYTLATSVYIDAALSHLGIKLGEVQAAGSAARYFGPLGDQVGFILLLFLYTDLLASRALRASFFGLALLLTGTRGALIALGAGIIALLLQKRWKRFQGRRYLLPLGVFCGLAGLALWWGFGGMLERFLNAEIFGFGLTQRTLTMTLAVRVFLDNFLLGVGFTGFRFAAFEYGAEALFSQQLYFAPAFIATAGNQFLQVATDAGLLGLVAFVWMARSFLQALKRAQGSVASPLREFMGAGHLWLLSLLIGNQTAAWLLPGSIISYFVWIMLGIATVAMALARRPRTNNARLETPAFVPVVMQDRWYPTRGERVSPVFGRL